jgi:hypothetical protein
VKKNLFNIHTNNSSGVDDQSHDSQVGQDTCEPCTLECEKMNMKINGRKLSDIEEKEIIKTLTPFKY